MRKRQTALPELARLSGMIGVVFKPNQREE
jgi:hypothetical protein